jgi:hypothetical protein
MGRAVVPMAIPAAIISAAVDLAGVIALRAIAVQDASLLLGGVARFCSNFVDGSLLITNGIGCDLGCCDTSNAVIILTLVMLDECERFNCRDYHFHDLHIA